MEFGTVPTPSQPTPSVPNYLAVSGVAGDLWFGEWPNGVLHGQGFTGIVADMAISPNRIAVVDTTGNAFIKDFRSHAPGWSFFTNNVSKIAITDRRIAVLKKQGDVWTAQDSYVLHYAAAPVRSIALSPNRLVVVGEDNIAYIRIGSAVAPGWQRAVVGVHTAAVSDNRFAILNPNGEMWANEGDIHNTIYRIHRGVRQIGVGVGRIFILGTDDRVYMREGQITSSGWVSVAGSVSSISASGNIIAVRNAIGEVWAGTGHSLRYAAAGTDLVATTSAH